MFGRKLRTPSVQKDVTDVWKSRWPNFEPQEVLSPDGYRLWLAGNLVINTEALDKLQAFRNYVKYPLICNDEKLKLRYRGFRSYAENMKVQEDVVKRGGKPSKFSMHMMGLAFDIHSPDQEVDNLYRDAVNFGWNGIGKYRTFIHVDNRPLLKGMQPRRW